LEQVVKTLSGSSTEVRRAQVLWKADADGPVRTDAEIADAFGVPPSDGRERARAVRHRRVRRGAERSAPRAAPEGADRRARGAGDRSAVGTDADGVRQRVVCVSGRRFGTLGELRAQATAWPVRTNDRQRGVDWQFQIDDARAKLKSLYPKLAQ
jgi:hypothetical protein